MPRKTDKERCYLIKEGTVLVKEHLSPATSETCIDNKRLHKNQR